MLSPLRTALSGYSSGSTIDMPGVARTNGKVASGLLRLKTTSRSLTARTLSRLPSRPAGPPLTLIFRMRSIEYLTARASSLCPSEKVRPDRSSQL